MRKTVAIATAAAILVLGSIANAEEPIRFNRDVRPILSGHCFQCHGPDQHDRKADLRLDEEEGIRQAFGDGLADSEGWLRILSEDDDERMPPPSAHKELKPEQRAVLKRWVESGAGWEGHWAFTPPTRPETPAASSDDWVRNPIDAFILARLRREGLKPTKPADRERLLRRITFDLTGMPPTIEEIDAFLADNKPGAYERVVDRLLNSKYFGERMAAAWMDLARYGDSSVFHADGPRDMWPWRDWVIQSYNDNKPFNAFTVEQLAGDLLPKATVEQRIATGFNRNNATTDEGGAIAEEYRVEYVVDRVKTTSMVWLGLTLECAQCHDHKYDPITQQDYYRFYAFFNQAADPGMQTRRGNQTPTADVPNYLLREERTDLLQQQTQLKRSLADRIQAGGDAFQAWLAKVGDAASDDKPKMPGGAILHFPLDEGKGAQVASVVKKARKKAKINGKPIWIDGKLGKAAELDGGSHIVLGNLANFERTDSFSYGAWVKPKGAGQGTVLSRMDDGAGYRGYDLLLSGGKVEVHIVNRWPNNAIKVRTKGSLKPDQWQHVFVTYDGGSKAKGVTVYFDGKPQEHDVQQDSLSKTIRTKKPLLAGKRSASAPLKGAIDDIRFYNRKLSAAEAGALSGYDPIGELLAVPAEERTETQTASLQDHFYRTQDKPYQKIHRSLQAVERRLAQVDKPISTVMVMQDVAKPRMTYILDRGSYDAPKKDQAVTPDVLQALPPLPDGSPNNRLGLAQWIVRPDHPLTSRVAVNRYWYMLFGRGLVETVEDFGSQGQWPTHPALLDWLAVEFVESGWDIKHMIRLMATSSAYRQSSRMSPELEQRDPRNLLLARGPRFRLQAEFIRDNALAASGLLVDKTGGPSVKPYQPPGLWNAVSLSGNVRFVQDKGEKVYRRGMYTYWKRSAPAPFLTLFDAPSREKCIIRRSSTNTPLQALVVLNDPQYVEAARTLAQRVMQAEGDPRKRIERAYRLAAGVRPSPATLDLLERTYQEEQQVFAGSPDRAKALLAVGDSGRDERLSASEHAAMTVVCSIILNLDATLTRG